MKGLLNINKPKGISSAAVVGRAKRILGYKKIGHMGTLDPAGCGVLVLGVGKAARLFDFFLNKDKVYEAEFAFGYETDTLDGEGVVTSGGCKVPTLEQLQSAAQKFVGEIDQMPPLYSAKNVDGRRAYDMARAGERFTLTPSRVSIYQIDILRQTAPGVWLFRVHCGSGTYIRSLCRDIAYEAGSKATMISICRIKSGNFLLSDAVTLERLEALGESALIPIEHALADVARICLDEQTAKALADGKRVQHEPFDGMRLATCDGEAIALVTCGGELKIKTFLRD